MFKKYLCLDVGDVRIGVARSDGMGMFAHPLEVIDRKKTKAMKRIKELCAQENTKSIVVGIPKSLDGTEKVQAEKVRDFIEKMKKEISGVEIIEVDERLSTGAFCLHKAWSQHSSNGLTTRPKLSKRHFGFRRTMSAY